MATPYGPNIGNALMGAAQIRGAQQREQMNALALRGAQREEDARNYFAQNASKFLDKNPTVRNNALMGLAQNAPQSFGTVAEIVSKYAALEDAQRKRAREVYDAKNGIVSQFLLPLKQVDPARRQQIFELSVPQLKEQGGLTDDELRNIDFSDEGIDLHVQTSQDLEKQFARIDKLKEQGSKDANNPFRADGTPNKAYQDYEIAKAGASARVRAATAGGGTGKTITERMNNELLSGDPSTPQYGAAYAYVSKPRVVFDPQTGEQITVTPDMSWARKPTAGASQNGGGANRAPGQPTIAASPGQGASPTRATYEANVQQAQSDIDVAERMFFPQGQFDRGMAVTGTTGLPLTQGREASQAIERAVEVMLRLRTGAAAPVEEVRKYSSMFSPSALDNDEGAKRKLQRMREFFEESKRVAKSKLPREGTTGNAVVSQADPLGLR